ncbi:peptidylprolyl isomerase [Consotaella salsifontis]|uniref:Peptidyl-prolyl cis-trans isomerase n=1 Tax=Consotaella salsifontis TaxID=1365950 RepID=A0A1T4LTR0_9HYPH|nr:peptidylprolyl isomerase [Consotaella salsifontis]SJZ58129.1 peptidylprolyl isomerase/peptidyl-prolyl cis-trans isomerase B (cyclophilin B) [Consotaella salsifontis]
MGISTRIAGAALALTLFSLPALAADPQNTLVITTSHGEIDVALRPDLAPNHVKRIKELAREGAYDGVVFHRVIDGFMAQTGDVEYGKEGSAGFDVRKAGMGGSDKPDLKAEFSDAPFKRGVVGMARSSDPDSANSQFFIMLADGDFLNGQYTVLGEVEKGMEVVDAIKKGDPSRNGSVDKPDKIVEAHIAADKK